MREKWIERTQRNQQPVKGLPGLLDKAISRFGPSYARVVDRAIEVIDPITAQRREESRLRLELSSGYYRGAEHSRLMKDWSTLPPTASTDASSWELETLRSRSRHLSRNDPIAAGAKDTIGTNVVGSGLKPQSKLRAEVLGISEPKAKALKKQAERIFEAWSPMADSFNQLNFDELQFLAIQKIVEDGEIFGLPTWANEPWRKYGRCLELVEADRVVSSKAGYEHGILKGKRGEIKTYGFLMADNKTYKYIDAFDKQGRPQVIHAFPSSRVGQLRGVSLFAPTIQLFKHLGDFIEAKVVSARVAACLAVFVTQNDAYVGSLANQSRLENAKRVQELEPALISYLETGESINVVDPKGTSDPMGPFLEGLIRLIGVSLGMPYELIMKDFSKTNYSSARAALLEGRRFFSRWRVWFARKFCQPLYDLVIEEAFLRGEFEARNFYEFRTEYCRASWIGGSWGYIDPVKEVLASKKSIDYGLSSLPLECAAQGRDWEEMLEEKAAVEAKKKELEITTADEKPPQPIKKPGDQNGTGKP